MSRDHRIVRAITVDVGDDIVLVDGTHKGMHATVTRKRPASTMYATHVKIKCTRELNHFQGKWIPVTMWRKAV